jgi:lipoate-protein ligase A
MYYLDQTLPTIEENLALDEALLLDAETGQGAELLRVWEWRAFAVVLGAGCRWSEDVDAPACQEARVPIVRRASGGGTVLLARGCLLYSLVLAQLRAAELSEVRSSYRFILDRIRAALLDLQPDLECTGTSDLAVSGRKVSGNAQQRKRTHLLHHGTLLYDFPIPAISGFLRLPARQPQYRNNRSHEDFMANVGATAAELKTRLRQAWQADAAISHYPRTEVERLVAEKYRRPDWTYRR